MVPIGTPLAVVADSKEQVDEAVMRLARVGHETVDGYILAAGYDGETKRVEQVSVEDASEMTRGEVQFVDVRRVAEHAGGHAPNTVNLPLDRLSTELDKLDPERPTYVICQGGYRSSLGTSILENAGFKELYNVTGGTAAWIKAGLPTEASETACAVTR
jgi:hydroxyacylglutathione hydrolase